MISNRGQNKKFEKRSGYFIPPKITPPSLNLNEKHYFNEKSSAKTLVDRFITKKSLSCSLGYVLKLTKNLYHKKKSLL